MECVNLYAKYFHPFLHTVTPYSKTTPDSTLSVVQLPQIYFSTLFYGLYTICKSNIYNNHYMRKMYDVILIDILYEKRAAT